MKINFYALKAIYFHEMDRFRRTLTQSLLSPVLTTSLYFIVFGSVIGGYVEKIDGISYGSYIVPGLLMLTLLTQSISNTSFGIFFPKFNGTIYELAEKYKKEGMTAYSRIQQQEFAREKDGYTSVKHQREVGTSYFDAVSNTISSGQSSTTAMAGSTESEQF